MRECNKGFHLSRLTYSGLVSLSVVLPEPIFLNRGYTFVTAPYLMIAAGVPIHDGNINIFPIQVLNDRYFAAQRSITLRATQKQGKHVPSFIPYKFLSITRTTTQSRIVRDCFLFTNSALVIEAYDKTFTYCPSNIVHCLRH